MSGQMSPLTLIEWMDAVDFNFVFIFNLYNGGTTDEHGICCWRLGLLDEPDGEGVQSIAGQARSH